MLEMTREGREMTDEELKANPAVEQEWDIQWEIFRLLADCEERDLELIKACARTCARLARAIYWYKFSAVRPENVIYRLNC